MYLKKYNTHGTCTRCGIKSNPLKLFAVFSATAWNFCVKFYTFTWLFYLLLNAQQNLIIFKYDEVIDILVWPPSDFCVLKHVCIMYHSVREQKPRFLYLCCRLPPTNISRQQLLEHEIQRLDNLDALFQQVGHRDESPLRFFLVTVETGSGDRQPHKSASSLVNPIASSAESRCTGFSVPYVPVSLHVLYANASRWSPDLQWQHQPSWTDAPQNELRGALESTWLSVHDQDFAREAECPLLECCMTGNRLPNSEGQPASDGIRVREIQWIQMPSRCDVQHIKLWLVFFQDIPQLEPRGRPLFPC